MNVKQYNQDWTEISNLFFKDRKWRLLRIKIINILGHKCVKCGSTENIQCDHVISRSDLGLGFRWLDPTNLQILCAKCNSDKGKISVDYRTKEQFQSLTLILKENTSKDIDWTGYEDYFQRVREQKRVKRKNVQ